MLENDWNYWNGWNYWNRELTPACQTEKLFPDNPRRFYGFEASYFASGRFERLEPFDSTQGSLRAALEHLKLGIACLP